MSGSAQAIGRAALDLSDEGAEHLRAAFIALPLSQPQRLTQRSQPFVAVACPETPHGVQRPKPGVLARGKAGLAQRKHRFAILATACAALGSLEQDLLITQLDSAGLAAAHGEVSV
jgi:hypothetical protein